MNADPIAWTDQVAWTVAWMNADSVAWTDQVADAWTYDRYSVFTLQLVSDTVVAVEADPGDSLIVKLKEFSHRLWTEEVALYKQRRILFVLHYNIINIIFLAISYQSDKNNNTFSLFHNSHVFDTPHTTSVMIGNALYT